MQIHYLTLLTTVLIASAFASEVCVKNTEYSCNTEKYGEVSLKGIAGELGYLEYRNKFIYRFYPDGAKEDWEGHCTVQDGPAFCQGVPNHAGTFTFNLGTLSSMSVQSFDIQEGKVVTVFNYTGGTNKGETNRSTEIALVCDSNAIDPVFEIVEEKPVLHYRFRLTSHKVCPSLMDNGCQRIDSCSCWLDNDKGFITVHGVLEALRREWLEIETDGVSYSLSPCPIKTNQTAYKYCAGTTGDPAACMETPDGEKFTLGLQSEMKFTVTERDPYTTALVYHGGSTIAGVPLKIILILQCDINTLSEKVEFLGENPWLSYNFRIISKQMCPHW